MDQEQNPLQSLTGHIQRATNHDTDEDDNYSDAETLPYDEDRDMSEVTVTNSESSAPIRREEIPTPNSTPIDECGFHMYIRPRTSDSERDRDVCTRRSDCAVKEHKAQGILCKEHETTLTPYRDSIEFALVHRITRAVPGQKRECLLCPSILKRGEDTVKHVRGHGSELGKVTHPHMIRMSLTMLDLASDNNGPICEECSEEQANSISLLIHSIISHPNYPNCPLICTSCLHPTLGQPMDKHWEMYHTNTCCGKILTNLEDQVKHDITCHPRNLEKFLDSETLMKLHIITAEATTTSYLPWGKAIRLISSRTSEILHSRRSNSYPAPHTQEFRTVYSPGQKQSPVLDIILPACGRWTKTTQEIMGNNQTQLIIVEQLMIQHMATILGTHLGNSTITPVNPLYTEILLLTSNDHWCNTCEDRADHKYPQLCINKKKCMSMTAHFTAEKIGEHLIRNYAGILIGCEDKSYGTTPTGQHPLLNLAMTGKDPTYCTGYDNGHQVIFKKNGKHQLLNPEKDFFQHIRKMVAKLPTSYMRPVIVEFFLMKHDSQTEEEIESQVEAYLENLNNVRLDYHFLFVVIGPVLNGKMKEYTPEEYTINSKRLDLINRILSAFTVKYQMPFFSTQGVINSLPQEHDGRIYWTSHPSLNLESVVDHLGYPMREHVKRSGMVTDMIIEGYLRTTRSITNNIGQQLPHQQCDELIKAKEKKRLFNRKQRQAKARRYKRAREIELMVAAKATLVKKEMIQSNSTEYTELANMDLVKMERLGTPSAWQKLQEKR